jgi:uncharacterized protein YneF (UPF0154 family)
MGYFALLIILVFISMFSVGALFIINKRLKKEIKNLEEELRIWRITK